MNPNSTWTDAEKTRITELLQEGFGYRKIHQMLLTEAKAQAKINPLGVSIRSIDSVKHKTKAIANQLQADVLRQEIEDAKAEYVPTADDVAAEKARIASGRQMRRLSDQKSVMKKDLDFMYRRENAYDAFLTNMIAQVPKLEVPQLQVANASEASIDTEAVILHITDIHAQEIIKKSTVSGLNAYDPDIFSDRIQAVTDGFISLLGKESTIMDVKKVVVVLGGDFVSGLIHGLDRYQAFDPVTVAINTAHIVALVVRDVTTAAHNLGIEVFVTGVAGNHGRIRDSMTNQNANAPRESWDWLIYAFVAESLKDTGIQFYFPDSLYSLFDANGKTGLVIHGDFMNKGRTPAEKAYNSMREIGSALSTHIDFVIFGHYHFPSAHEGCAFGTGGLKGVDGYVWTGLQKNNTPQQAAYLVRENYIVQVPLIANEHTVEKPRYRQDWCEAIGDPQNFDYKKNGAYVFGRETVKEGK